eukprot:gene6775-8685_t
MGPESGSAGANILDGGLAEPTPRPPPRPSLKIKKKGSKKGKADGDGPKRRKSSKKGKGGTDGYANVGPGGQLGKAFTDAQ